jgi:membrane fusion protein (multidrug efflux system)
VRIWLAPQALAEHPLQVGLSMNVTVDLHDQSGPRLGLLAQADTPQGSAPERTLYSEAARAADARVAAVIAANAANAPR